MGFYRKNGFFRAFLHFTTPWGCNESFVIAPWGNNEKPSLLGLLMFLVLTTAKVVLINMPLG